VSGVFVDGYGFASADILRDEKSVVKAEIHSALSISAHKEGRCPPQKWHGNAERHHSVLGKIVGYQPSRI
jgi:hypothetical protein